MSEPQADGLDAERLSADLVAISELVETGVELDGEVQVAASTWVIYGHTSYDGEIVAGEYEDAAEASAVLRASQRREPDDGSVR